MTNYETGLYRECSKLLDALTNNAAHRMTLMEDKKARELIREERHFLRKINKLIILQLEIEVEKKAKKKVREACENDRMGA